MTPSELEAAIAQLFKQNGYTVEGPKQVFGASVDLVATPESQPFAPSVYVEATVSYVNNDKFGRDAGKLAVILRQDPGAKCLIVSEHGFTQAIMERGEAAGFELLTYDELFRRFERFEPYVDSVVGKGASSKALRELSLRYEPADFSDQHGKSSAIETLTAWKDGGTDPTWLIVLGEYGTGKTALTEVCLYRWMEQHKTEPSRPIPIRIELKNFVKQFDARSLLHDFLDRNGLSSLPIDFFLQLIRQGRIVLILDGYDEMAQSLDSRERRACLAAFAELASEGARGILTSRPNYFTEAEELGVLEALYKKLDLDRKTRTHEQRRRLYLKEEELDNLLKTQFLNRYERTLRDLTEAQMNALVGRILAGKVDLQETVLNLMDRINRTHETESALTGKPVILTYLMDLAAELSDVTVADDLAAEGLAGDGALGEFSIFDIIVERLMLRDFNRVPNLSPGDRRWFLQHLAVLMTEESLRYVAEDEIRDLVARLFASDIRRLPPSGQAFEVERRTADLRSSSTLTRGSTSSGEGWSFSHNALREFLVVQYMLEALKGPHSRYPERDMAVTDAMASLFATSNLAVRDSAMANLSAKWPLRQPQDGSGAVLCLVLPSLLELFGAEPDPIRSSLSRVVGEGLDLSSCSIRWLSLRATGLSDLRGCSFVNSSISSVTFERIDFAGANFKSAALDGVKFMDCNLEGATFNSSIMEGVVFDGCSLQGAHFRDTRDQLEIIVDGNALVSDEALGFLRTLHAETDRVDDYFVVMHHEGFPIMEKILRHLVENPAGQVRGLTQRGVAARNPRLARAILERLQLAGLVSVEGGDRPARITQQGREVAVALLDEWKVDGRLVEVLKRAL